MLVLHMKELLEIEKRLKEKNRKPEQEEAALALHLDLEQEYLKALD